MKKIFVVSGELSGDLLGAWYLNKKYKNKDVYIEAIGGDNLASAGAILYKRFEGFNVVGITEIIRHIPRLLAFIRSLIEYIKKQEFDEVLVIDFPGFNLHFIKRLKNVLPKILITYFSPPQLWCWGAWRLKTLKKYSDRVVVLYPFEVDWYFKRGLIVEWIGSPIYDRMASILNFNEDKKNIIALLPGSRESEVLAMFPLFIKIALELKKKYSGLSFLIPKAESISYHILQKCFEAAGVDLNKNNSFFEIVDDKNKERLAQCCMAISKPGTVTLELALLKIQSIIVFKVSWITYFIAKWVVNVDFMGLPNLFLNESVFPEFIQTFSFEQIIKAASEIYESVIKKDEQYIKNIEKLSFLTDKLRSIPN